MRTRMIYLILAFFIPYLSYSQERSLKKYRVVCYNVENYFDLTDDPETADEEFLPNGLRAWNNTKYRQKQANISKVIAALGDWDAPPIVGLCEVESEKALRDLTKYAPLSAFKYKFIHYESPDPRGIDVALLYQASMFEPIHSEALRIKFQEYPEMTTRDILYVSGKLPTNDTIHIFVCHFPSRLGGELESEYKRLTVAAHLREKVDCIFKENPLSNIIIMGDFNDYPNNKSLSNVLRAKDPAEKILENELYNLMIALQNAGKGSHKHQGEWGALDQIIVSGNLLNPSNRFYALPQDAQIFDADFLLEDDKNYLGKQAFRTYIGMKYNHGFSDHLPVYIDFWY